MKRHQKGERLNHADVDRFEQDHEWWRRYKAYGEGGERSSAPANFSIVMAANYTETQVQIGDVCEFDGNPFSDVDPSESYPDPRNDRWLKAVTPDTIRVGWGIALEPMQDLTGDDRPGGAFLTVGVCHARVRITDEAHTHADRKNGERILHSCPSGPVKILHKPTGSTPETRLCLVELVAPGDIVDIIEVNDTGSSGGYLIYAESSNSFAFPGNFRRWNSTSKTFDNKGNCWLLLTNEWGEVAGDVPAVNGQYYGPAKYLGIQDFGGVVRPTYTCYRGELATEIVEVNHEVESSEPDAGDIVPANADGYHSGRIRKSNGLGFDPTQDIWIRFVNNFTIGGVSGAVLAVQGQFYGPAKYSGQYDLVENEGEEDETHDERPVFVCECSEAIFLCKFNETVSEGSTGAVTLWHSSDLTESDQTISGVIAWGSGWESGKKGVVQRIAGKWAASQTEWEC